MLIAALLFAASIANPSEAHYLGPETCALCHQAIAAKQQQTAMANTWQGRISRWLPNSLHVEADEPGYELTRSEGSLNYAVILPDGEKLILPVETTVGGQRHGLGFLTSLKEIDGMPLARPAMIQARYAWSPEKKRLLLAPGCLPNKPLSVESALGLVLSPTFAARCLSCHGEPNSMGSGPKGGVHCESCHGPASAHLTAISHGTPNVGVVNPKRLSSEDSIAICAQCHVGLTKFSDPSPDDLLVANQVRAIRSSECFIQSGKAFSCTTCHNPHSDSEAGDQRAISACLGCHSERAALRAGICPVNSKGNCVTCHMPSVEMGPLHLVDHLIRVHPEQRSTLPATRSASLRTQIRPISEYLRILTTPSRETAETALRRLNKGELFYEVARGMSVHGSAPIGGYLGRKTLSEMDRILAEKAAQLTYGEISGLIETDRGWTILQRLPRDFHSDAERLQLEAEQLSASGDVAAGIQNAQQALMIYPQYLRALNFIGVTFSQNGNPKKGAQVLASAAHLYPDDAGTKFLLASTFGLLKDDFQAGHNYEIAISLDPDFTAAYLNLGIVLYSRGDFSGAIKTLEDGLRINPLSADLYYNLGIALRTSGDEARAQQAINLARKLAPAPAQ